MTDRHGPELSLDETRDVLIALTGGGIAAGDPTLVGWPYDDLKLRCPHCPACGDPGRLTVGSALHPIGWCADDDCDVLTWDPSASAAANLANSGRLRESRRPAGPNSRCVRCGGTMAEHDRLSHCHAAAEASL